jgi:outer membrane protein assembly factor BamA
MTCSFLLLLFLICLSSQTIYGQGEQKTHLTGFNITGIPVLSFNSDEGFGYGARLSLFYHAQGEYNPYYYLIDTEISATTGGKKEAFVFFDSPFLLGKGNRVTGEIRYQDNDFQPFYGLGHQSEYVEDFTDENHPDFINKNYYRFGRKRVTGWLDYQRAWGSIRALAGLGINHTDVTELEGITALGENNSVTGKAGGMNNYVKLGLIYDTRDFEPAPTRGDWLDAVFEWSGKMVASDYDYRRLTITHRHYFRLARNGTLAVRLGFIKTWGDIPFYETAFMASTFRIQEGIGGSKSARGLLKNRYMGPVEAFGNIEARRRIVDFRMMGQDLFLALAAFFDFGSAWNSLDKVSLDTLHAGRGGGIHLGWDESFIISIDAGTGEDVGLGLYIGIGYLF